MHGLSAPKRFLTALGPVALCLAGATSMASAQVLDSFGVLGGSTVTNTGTSVITGDVGVSPGGAITGLPPGIVNAPYVIHANDEVAVQAQSELTTTYNDLAGRSATVNLSNQDLGGLTLSPGVYSFDAAAQLTGTVTLDGLNNPNARFIFIIGSTLTTSSASAVLLQNGAQGANVSFVVGSSATLGTDTSFAGEILALSSITLNTGADILCGAALARNGAVTLDTNTISICTTAVVDIGDVIGSSPTSPSTGGETAVADAIDDYIAGGGVLPAGFADLVAFLSPEELQRALAELGGEAGTAVAPAGIQATRDFLGQVTNRLRDEDSAVADRGPDLPARDAPESSTVRVLGYGPDDAKPLTAVADFAPSRHRSAERDPSLWDVWVSAYGAHSLADGDGFGPHERTIETMGIASGIDFLVTPDTRLGVAVSGARSDFALSDGFGGGDADVVQAALYGRTDLGAAYVSGALAYAWDDVSTHRTMTVGGDERFDASFSAYDIAGQVEAGYRMALPDMPLMPGSIWLIPYAALQVHSFHTPDYGESTASGSDDFALDYEARTTDSVRTELGLRLEQSMLLGDDTSLNLRTGVAWAHDSQDTPRIDAGFQSLPGSSFTIYGADEDPDALLVSAGAELRFGNGFGAAARGDGSFASGYQSYAGSVRLSYAW